MAFLRPTAIVAAALAVWVAAWAEGEPARPPAAAPAESPSFFCFDFDSPFDGGRFGARVARVFRGTVQRREYFPTMIEWDVEEKLARDDFRASKDTGLKAVLDHAQANYGAAVAVFGSAERQGAGYRLTIKAAIRDGESGDRLALEETHDAPNVHHIPIIADAFLRRLVGDSVPDAPADDEAERRWAEGANMLKAGRFERGDPHPPGWDPFGKPTQHGTVSLAPGVLGREGTVLRFEMDKEVAATYGTQYYSESMPAELGATYRFKIDAASAGPAMIVFIKCYDEVTDPETGQTQLREVYRKQHNVRTRRGQWSEAVTTFTPRLTATMEGRSVKVMRVMLYAFHPAGECWWDNAVMKKIADAPETVEPYEPGTKQRQEP